MYTFVDGIRLTDWASGSCGHTANTPGGAWWQVDLGGVFVVDHVNVYHRSDCCTERMLGAEVVVSDTPTFGDSPQTCGTMTTVTNDFPRPGACDDGTFLGGDVQDSLEACEATCTADPACNFVSYCPAGETFCVNTNVNKCSRYTTCSSVDTQSAPGEAHSSYTSYAMADTPDGIKGPAFGSAETIVCPPALSGRYVTVTQAGYVQLCELEVMTPVNLQPASAAEFTWLPARYNAIPGGVTRRIHAQAECARDGDTVHLRGFVACAPNQINCFTNGLKFLTLPYPCRPRGPGYE